MIVYEHMYQHMYGRMYDRMYECIYEHMYERMYEPMYERMYVGMCLCMCFRRVLICFNSKISLLAHAGRACELVIWRAAPPRFTARSVEAAALTYVEVTVLHRSGFLEIVEQHKELRDIAVRGLWSVPPTHAEAEY